MSKTIINHDGTVTDQEAVMSVYLVIEQGRVSAHKNGDHYCWHTSFGNGTHVSTRTKRRTNSADSFYVWKEP